MIHGLSSKLRYLANYIDNSVSPSRTFVASALGDLIRTAGPFDRPRPTVPMSKEPEWMGRPVKDERYMLAPDPTREQKREERKRQNIKRERDELTDKYPFIKVDAYDKSDVKKYLNPSEIRRWESGTPIGQILNIEHHLSKFLDHLGRSMRSYLPDEQEAFCRFHGISSSLFEQMMEASGFGANYPRSTDLDLKKLKSLPQEEMKKKILNARPEMYSIKNFFDFLQREDRDSYTGEEAQLMQLLHNVNKNYLDHYMVQRGMTVGHADDDFEDFDEPSPGPSSKSTAPENVNKRQLVIDSYPEYESIDSFVSLLDAEDRDTFTAMERRQFCNANDMTPEEFNQSMASRQKYPVRSSPVGGLYTPDEVIAMAASRLNVNLNSLKEFIKSHSESERREHLVNVSGIETAWEYFMEREIPKAAKVLGESEIDVKEFLNLLSGVNPNASIKDYQDIVNECLDHSELMDRAAGRVASSIAKAIYSYG